MSADGTLPDGCSHADVDAAAPDADQQPWAEPSRAQQLAEEAAEAARRAGFTGPHAVTHFQVGWLSCELARSEGRVALLREILAAVPAPDEEGCPF